MSDDTSNCPTVIIDNNISDIIYKLISIRSILNSKKHIL